MLNMQYTTRKVNSNQDLFKALISINVVGDGLVKLWKGAFIIYNTIAL